MCDPTALMMATNSTGQMMQIEGTNRQARAEARAANRSMDSQLNQLNVRQDEIDDDTNAQILERRRQQMREEGRLKAAFGDAGIVGASPEREVYSSRLQAGQEASTHETMRDRRQGQIRAEAEAVRAKSEERIKSAQSSILKPFTAALQVGQGNLQGYMAGKELERTMGNSSGGGGSSEWTDADYGRLPPHIK